jgi:hypothetical protein
MIRQAVHENTTPPTAPSVVRRLGATSHACGRRGALPYPPPEDDDRNGAEAEATGSLLLRPLSGPGNRRDRFRFWRDAVTAAAGCQERSVASKPWRRGCPPI